MEKGHHGLHKLSAAGLLVTLGIIYGDIGTSPLYVLNAIIGRNPIDSDIIKGAISCIFWTLTLQTTIKYVILTLRADNNGEGGIFSLYALIRKAKIKWLLFPAIIGGCTLLADGIITPPISVSSAIEGVKTMYPSFEEKYIMYIVIIILTLLFAIQQFGTKFIGKFFGPVMFVWFAMLGGLGLIQTINNVDILSALNPYYAYKLLSIHGGYLYLGAVFLCTTGAEALYSDLGHCGKDNIRISWIFVKATLILNYLGQGAWLLQHDGQTLVQAGITNPFYGVMPQWFLPFGIAIATLAAIVASQALISGSFTLINEAIRLNFWPKVKIKYPTELRGQLYIPSLNWLLWAGCIFIVLYFEKAAAMEAAYGLAIVLTMLMTTTLLNFYMILKRYNRTLIWIIVITYLIIELSFLYACLHKFGEGGYITLIIAFVLFAVMTCWYFARKIRNRFVEFVKLDKYLPVLEDLSRDESIAKYATNLVYLTSADNRYEIESKIIYSIINNSPKRADIYWFAHVHVVDEPYTMEYRVCEFIHDDVIRIDFRLGFRIAPKFNKMFAQVVKDMQKRGEIDLTSRYTSLNKHKIISDFRFVLIEKFMSYDNALPFYEKLILDGYNLLKKLGLSEERAFGLDPGSVTIEKFPLKISETKAVQLTRID